MPEPVISLKSENKCGDFADICIYCRAFTLIQLLLQMLLERDQEPLANEYFAQQQRVFPAGFAAVGKIIYSDHCAKLEHGGSMRAFVSGCTGTVKYETVEISQCAGFAGCISCAGCTDLNPKSADQRQF